MVIMMSFGVVFPPILIIITFSLCVRTWFEEICIGRLLFESQRLHYDWYQKQLLVDCANLSDGFEYTLWSVVPVSSLLLGYIVFDSMGDAYGWKIALIPSSIMIFLPLLVLIFLSYGKYISSSWNRLLYGDRVNQSRGQASIAVVENPVIQKDIDKAEEIAVIKTTTEA
jgi:hypothetical protein